MAPVVARPALRRAAGATRAAATMAAKPAAGFKLPQARCAPPPARAGDRIAGSHSGCRASPHWHPAPLSVGRMPLSRI